MDGGGPRRAEPDAATAFPFAGETGALILARDWRNTALGPIEEWDLALRGPLSTYLAAEAQVALFWGPDHLAFYNDAYAATIGDKHPAALGRPAREGWAELWEDLGPMLERVRVGGESIGARDRPFRINRRGHEEEVFFDISYSPARNGRGVIQGVLCLVSETTERVRASRHVEAERERLRQMFAQAPSFMALLDEPGHRFAFTNTAFDRLVGPRPVIGRTVAEALPEVEGQGQVALLDEVARTGRPYTGRDVPVELWRQPGEPPEQRIIDIVFQPVRDGSGRVTGIFVEGTDVTDRVRAEERAATSEGTLRLATEVAGVGTWDSDVLRGELHWNEQTMAMFGLLPGERPSLALFELALHPEDRARVMAAFGAALDPALRAPYDVEYRAIGRHDGAERWIAAKGRGLFDEAGRCVRAIGTAIDITPRRRALDALAESEERFRAAADSAPALIWMCDGTGALTFANRWHEEMFGRSGEAMLGAGWHGIIHPDDLAAFTAGFDEAFARRAPFSRDVRVLDRHGATRWLRSEARPRFAEERFAGYVGCDVDITEAHHAAEALERRVAERTGELAASNRQLSAEMEERERMEATIRRMQRLEAVGQLTSGVAHDFNNLLTVILGNLDLVGRAPGMDERGLRRLSTMRTAAERGATLTAQLLAFSRRQRLEARAVDLGETVAGMRELIGSTMGGAVRLETRVADGLWPALVDATQLELVVLNLAINARDAMAVGGTLTVEAANRTLDAPRRPEEPPPGDYVMVAVGDTGTGMAPEVLDRAFEPFFTTKPVGKGSGLGLAQVYGFAKQSGGGVRIDTAPGAGTTVRVFLPRAVAMGEAAASGPDAGEAPDARGRRILVVDDDAPVREVTAAALAAMGARVDQAGSAAGALEALDRAGGGFDLLVADFAMPGMNGAELAAAAAQRWPALPVLFVTGYADLEAIGQVAESRVVQKPFRAEELQRKAARLIGPAPASVAAAE